MKWVKLEYLQSKVYGRSIGRLKLALQELGKGDFTTLETLHQDLSSYSELRNKELWLFNKKLIGIADKCIGLDDDLNSKYVYILAKLFAVIREFVLYIIKKQPTASSLCLHDFVQKCYLDYYEVTDVCFDVYLNKRKHLPRRIFKFLNGVELVNGELKFHVKWEDGMVSPFVLQFCPSYNYFEETLVYQLYELLNVILNEESATAKDFLKLRSPQSLLIGLNTKIMSEYDSSKTLLDMCAEVSSEREYKALFCDENILLSFYKFRKMTFLERKQFMKTPSELLKRWCSAHIFEPESYFKFREQFSKSLALNNIVKHAFGLDHLNPDFLYIDTQHGHVASYGLKFQTLNLRKFKATEIPFRLTPNISKFITAHGMMGYVKNVMLSATRCFHKHDQELYYFLEIIWNCLEHSEKNKELAKRGIKRKFGDDEDKNRRISQRVDMMVNKVLKTNEVLAELQTCKLDTSKLGANGKLYGSGANILALIESSQNLIDKIPTVNFWARYKWWL